MVELIDVIKVDVLPDYHLYLEFEDGRCGAFDVQPYLSRGVFKQLASIKEFQTAHIAGGTVAWSCGVDIAPERLYNELCVTQKK